MTFIYVAQVDNRIKFLDYAASGRHWCAALMGI